MSDPGLLRLSQAQLDMDRRTRDNLTESQASSSLKKMAMGTVVLAILGAAGYWAYRRSQSSSDTPSGGNGSGGSDADPGTPVTPTPDPGPVPVPEPTPTPAPHSTNFDASQYGELLSLPSPFRSATAPTMSKMTSLSCPHACSDSLAAMAYQDSTHMAMTWQFFNESCTKFSNATGILNMVNFAALAAYGGSGTNIVDHKYDSAVSYITKSASVPLSIFPGSGGKAKWGHDVALVPLYWTTDGKIDTGSIVSCSSGAWAPIVPADNWGAIASGWIPAPTDATKPVDSLLPPTGHDMILRVPRKGDLSIQLRKVVVLKSGGMRMSEIIALPLGLGLVDSQDVWQYLMAINTLTTKGPDSALKRASSLYHYASDFAAADPVIAQNDFVYVAALPSGFAPLASMAVKRG